MKERFKRLFALGLLTEKALEEAMARAEGSGQGLEETLVSSGIPRHEVLLGLTEYYGLPFVEYEEGITLPLDLLRGLDMERLKKALWCPLSVKDGRAKVVACRPGSPEVMEDAKRTLGVSEIDFFAALPSDLIRIIENNQDLNPGFPPSGGRTPLAGVRTHLAYRRSAFAYCRTLFAKGRTGLAFVRTGVAFIAISLLFLRVLGAGIYAALEAPLLLAGAVMVFDGVKWYLPSRRTAARPIPTLCTEPTWGTTVLEADARDGRPVFCRSRAVEGAERCRAGWEKLSPVMRRRFLASDRTDMAEERTDLAAHRTKLARARTGLAFTRTGTAFVGLGVALFRYFHTSWWTAFDLSLAVLGVLMAAEGFYWYFGGRRAGIEGLRSVMHMAGKESIWDMTFPLGHKRPESRKYGVRPPVHASHLPGIWATTGHALERTLLADRRGVMAGLRTVMAVERTGMAFIRTGMTISSVGAGLLMFFGTASAGWSIFNTLLILAGLALIADGYRWVVPTGRIKMQYPFYHGEMEITIPDYGVPAGRWRKVVFDHYEPERQHG